MATIDLFPNLGKFTVTQFVTPAGRLTPEAARELALAQRILTAVGTAVAAVDVGVTPSGGISSVNVQDALVELDTEKADAASLAVSLAGKQPLDTTLTAVAGLATAADKLAYWSGVDVAALTDFTALARTLVGGTTAAGMRGTLGLGTLATQSGTFSGNSSGTNTGDQTITLTGDVTGSGGGSFATTVAANAITYAKMQDVTAASKLIGRGSAAGAGDPQEITVGSGLTMTGTTLSATAGGTGTVTTVSVATANGFAGTVANPTTTPAITLSTSVTGLLKGNGTAVSAAVANTDYVAPGGNIGAATGTSLAVTGALTSSGGSIGYATGAGGTVTQATSKTTTVTLNAWCGEITLNAAALAAGAIASFNLLNNKLTGTEIIVFSQQNGTVGAYTFNAATSPGAATVSVRNASASSLPEAITIRFAIVRIATS